MHCYQRQLPNSRRKQNLGMARSQKCGWILENSYTTFFFFLPLEQTDDGVLVYINIGRRLANLRMNHS